LSKNLKEFKEETSLFDVLTQFILTSIILGILINFVWWYYKFTEFLHKNLTSDDTFIDWLIKDNYQIFISRGFVVSLLISILSCLFALVLIWIFFRSSDNDESMKEEFNIETTTDEEAINIEDVDEETPAEEVKEEESPVEELEEIEEEESPAEEVEEPKEVEEEETPVEEVEQVEEESPEEKVKEKVIIQNEYEESLSIEEIERDFEKYNLLFIKKIYGQRVHRRKIMELERKVDKLKSLGEISEDYELY